MGSTESKSSVSVSEGLFTTQLDFGSQFDGNDRWLEITVDCGSGTSTLAPRQPLTPIPYAIHAQSVDDDAVTEDKLAATLTFDDGDLLDFSGVTANTQTEGVKLPSYNAGAIADGQITWDATRDSRFPFSRE